jgi:hypothetical protein
MTAAVPQAKASFSLPLAASVRQRSIRSAGFRGVDRVRQSSDSLLVEISSALSVRRFSKKFQPGWPFSSTKLIISKTQ